MNPNWLGNLKTRHIDIAAVSIMLIGATGLLVPKINPLLRSDSFAQQQQAQLGAALRNENDLNGFLIEQRARLAEIKVRLQKEKVHLESAENINQRIAKLTGLAAKTGLSVNEILPGAASRGERFDSVPVRMAASGSFPTCAAFLARLNQEFPDTSVSSFELSGDPQKPGTPAVFQVNLVWYASPGPQPSQTALNRR